jgi:hypothetical protein
MIVGYARVSTDGQTLDAQEAALRAAGAEKVFAEKITGAVTDRKALSKAIAALGPGDTLIVTRLDRLARSIGTYSIPLMQSARLAPASGPGCAKTRSDLVVMLCGARISALFCSPRDHSPQNSGCICTAQTFHTAWVACRPLG